VGKSATAISVVVYLTRCTRSGSDRAERCIFPARLWPIVRGFIEMLRKILQILSLKRFCRNRWSLRFENAILSRTANGSRRSVPYSGQSIDSRTAGIEHSLTTPHPPQLDYDDSRSAPRRGPRSLPPRTAATLWPLSCRILRRPPRLAARLTSIMPAAAFDFRPE